MLILPIVQPEGADVSKATLTTKVGVIAQERALGLMVHRMLAAFSCGWRANRNVSANDAWGTISKRISRDTVKIGSNETRNNNNALAIIFWF